MRGIVVGIDKEGAGKVYRVVVYERDSKSKGWRFKRQRVLENELINGISTNKIVLENITVDKGRIRGKTGDLSRFDNGVNRPIVILSEIIVDGQGTVGYKTITYDGVVKNITLSKLLSYCHDVDRRGGIPIQNGMYVKEQGGIKAHIRCYPYGDYIVERLERKVSDYAKPVKLLKDSKSKQAMAKLEEMFNRDQIRELKLGRQNGVDIKVLANNKLSAGQMKIIRETLEEGLRAELFADPAYSIDAMRLLRSDMKFGIDVKCYMSPEYSAEQLMELSVGCMSGVDISRYANPKNTPNEMSEIRIRLENNIWKELDVESDDTWK